MTVSAPPLLSEDVGRPPYTGCTWCTAVMMASFGGIHLPHGVTTDEHYALVTAAGMVVGHEAAKLEDVQRGFQERYGVQAHVFHGTIGDLARLGDAYVLVQGLYADLPLHYRRWDLAFTGIHSAGFIPSLSWWQDPLATQRMIGAGFKGEPIIPSLVGAYALGFGGQIHALYLKAAEFANAGGPAQPGGTMSTVNLTTGPVGVVRVKTDADHYWIDLASGQPRGPIKPATFGAVYAVPGIISPAVQVDPNKPHADRSTGYAVTVNGRASFLLATDVDFTPAPTAGAPTVIGALVHLSDGSSVPLKP